MFEPLENPQDSASGDLFEDPKVEAPSDGVYADVGKEMLEGIGEVIMPDPLPVEIIIEVKGWNYVYKLDRREKD